MTTIGGSGMQFGTVTNFDESATVRFERSIDSDPESVWKALTDGSQLERWLAPATLELEVGGLASIDFGDDQVVSGVVTMFAAPRLVEYSWPFPGEQDSILRFELAPQQGGTGLTLEHRMLPAEQAAGYGAGWHAHLDSLAAMLEGREPIDWDERFGEVLGTYVGA